jgi:O-antigen/teichoic acid export membrane protein
VRKNFWHRDPRVNVTLHSTPMSIARAPAAVKVNRASAARSALWSFVENGGLALISFSSLIVYSRFLSVSDFGLFSIVLAIVELMGVVVGMLFHDALVQRPGITELHYDTAFTATLVVSVLLMGACWLIAPMLAQRAGTPAAAPVLIWSSLSLPLAAVTATIAARQRRQLEFRTLALRSLIGRTLGAAVGIGLVVFGATFWGLVAQHVLVVFFGSVVLWIACRQRPRLRFGFAEFRQLIAFGGFSVAALFLIFSIKRAFIVLSGLTLGTHGAGLLNLSFRVVDTFWAIAATAVSQIALPILSTQTHDNERFKRVFRSASAFTCLTLFFCFVLIASTAAEIVEILFGKQWLGAVPFVTMLALLGLVQASRLLAPPVLTAFGRPRDLLIAQGAELAFIFGAILIFGVPSVGWAIALWVARECLGGSILVPLLRRAAGLGLRAQFSSCVVPLACAIATFGVVWMTRSALPSGWGAVLRLAVLGPVGAGVYLGSALALNRRLLLDLTRFGRSAVWQRKAGASSPTGACET